MFFPPGSLQAPKIETTKALILLDLQNDFVAANGNLPVANTASFLSSLPALIAKFREKGQVVFVQTLFRQPCPIFSPYTGGYNIMLKTLADHMTLHPRRDESITTGLTHDNDEPATHPDFPQNPDVEAFLNDTLPVTADRCCLPATKGAELAPQLARSLDKQKDMLLTKSEYSLFTDPLVVMQLRARLVTDLYISGSLSNVGVYATVLDAVQHGFSVHLIEDCLGFRDQTCHLQAMRQMADEFGASGIDYAELMDDLHGLLGDVVPASRYTRTFQLSVQAQNGPQPNSTQRVSQWMDTIESEPDEPDEPELCPEPTSNIEPVLASKPAAPLPNDSSELPLKPQLPPAHSPPRKRSTSDRDEPEDILQSKAGLVQDILPPPGPSDTIARPTLKKTRRESNTSKASEGPTSTPSLYHHADLYAVGHAQSTGHLETSRSVFQGPETIGRAMSQPEPLRTTRSPRQPKPKKYKQKFDPTYLGPDDAIGEGDCNIIHDVLLTAEADEAFSKLRYSTAWQKMYHRSGEVPRLVAVQGTVSPDGTIPIYRHPADESPPLRPFDGTVDRLRIRCEELVKHPLNHVLIQYYRTSEDNISEHSDKTLDIVRGSSIVNLSLGARRTMTLRTKKSSVHADAEAMPANATTTADIQPRITNRIHLPHNSLFVLGERTNASWLHAIKADKRPTGEKDPEELNFDGERISLTFRNIGTFIDPEKQTIWGQGATCKNREGAQAILTAKDAGEVGEQMIIGFGKENHLNDSEFDWQEVYGAGFDVVNFEITMNGE